MEIGDMYIVDGTWIPEYDPQEMLDAMVEEPVNPLDPIVYHDPIVSGSVIVKMQNAVKSAVSQLNVPNMPRDWSMNRVNGINTPVVYLNGIVLESNNIEALSLIYTDFLPTLKIIVRDTTKKYNLPDRPGLNNYVTVYIGPNIEGKYKGMKWNFYILDVDIDINRTRAIYTCEYKNIPLIEEQINPVVIKYKGCPAKNCLHDDQTMPTMFELCHEIAKEVGLGFAAMSDCKNSNNRTKRMLTHMSYKDFIEYNLSISGENETEVYDAWVDLRGYLTLVNLYTALNDEVDPANLAMYAETGLHASHDSLPNQKFRLCRRLLTNSKHTKSASNVIIKEYWQINDLNNIYNHGTLSTMYYMCPIGNNGLNGVSPEQVRIVEDSKDGKETSQYEINKYTGWSFVSCEEYNITRQNNIRTAYLYKKRANMLTIVLTQPNYAIDRGMLVSVAIMKYDYKSKVRIAKSTSVLVDNSLDETIEPDDVIDLDNTNINMNDVLYNDGIGLIDPSISGLYYVDGMRFDYFNNNENIQQYLYLIRREPLTNYINHTTIPKLRDPDAT